MNKRTFALGRLKQGEMNKTERAFAQHLDELKQKGLIVEYWFESIKLKVASNRCEYLPDFLALRSDGSLVIFEVKGAKAVWTDDRKVKCKVCADKYPFKLFVVYPIPKKNGGGWEIEEM